VSDNLALLVAPTSQACGQPTTARREIIWSSLDNLDTTKVINYCLSRWGAFTRFLDDGRLCMSNNGAERELRAVALGRRIRTFAGPHEGGWREAAICSLIATANLSDIDPQAWLTDVLARLPDHPAKRIHELLP
jgi:transposase